MPQPKHLTPLGHRIDFEALITVDSANPNGDPMKKGLPRTDSSGRGVISAVCIRRKLRNALAELGQPILISPPERPGDDLARPALRAPGELRYSGGGMPALVRRPRVRAGVFLQGNARAGR